MLKRFEITEPVTTQDNNRYHIFEVNSNSAIKAIGLQGDGCCCTLGN